MSVLRRYFEQHFLLDGQVLKLNLAALTSVFGQDYTKTYPFAAGAHNYTLDANWAPSAYPNSDHGAATVSGELGDGIDAPKFWVFGTNNIATNGLTRTTGARLRAQWNSGMLTAIWPNDNNGAVIWMPLPQSIDLSIEFTISSNAPAQGADNLVRFGIATSIPGLSLPCVIADVLWESDTGNQLDETVTIGGTSNTLSSIDSYVASGIGTRHYRIEMHGPNAAIYGGAVGATVANTLLFGRSNMLRANRNDTHLYVSLGASNGAHYAEIGDLSMTGKRAIF